MKIDFSKAYMNKYVLFKLSDWTTEHPHGVLVETLGNIDRIDLFYEYQLYCNSLNSSPKEMIQKIKEMTKNKTMDDYFQEIKSEPNYKIKDWTTIPHPPQVFTIDPVNAVDYDDGMSVMKCPDTSDVYVTIYIANVAFWLEKFNLWDSFDNRVATIYLPDRRRPMLPTILSETLCSLKEHTHRFALAVRFRITKDEYTWKIDESATTIQNVIIKPYKNYAYDDPKMVYQDVNYINLFETTVRLSNHIRNSSEMVAFWMITTNTYIAKFMYPHNAGIYRVSMKKKPAIKTVSEPRKQIVLKTPVSCDTPPKLIFPGEELENTNESEDGYHSDSSEGMDSGDSDTEMDPVVKENFEKLTMEEKRFIEGNIKSRSVLCEEVEKDEKIYARCTSGIRRYEDICNICEIERLMGVTLRGGASVKEYFETDKYNSRLRSVLRLIVLEERESEMISVGGGRYVCVGVRESVRVESKEVKKYEREVFKSVKLLLEVGYRLKYERKCEVKKSE